MCLSTCFSFYSERITQVRSTWPRLHLRAHQAGNRISSLFPTHTEHWWPILEDVAYSPALKQKFSNMLSTLEDGQEWIYVSTDATLRTCLKIKGQESYRASKAVRNSAPYPDAVAWRRLLTVRGRTGAVLLLEPVLTEKAEHVADAFKAYFSERALYQIRYIATDQPSPRLYELSKGACPNLECMCLDPIHLAIVYEYAQWNKQTMGSKMLRALLHRIIIIRDDRPGNSWGRFFKGSNPQPLDAEEEAMRTQILHKSMPEDEAREIIRSMDMNAPLHDRLEFITALAAICSLRKSEVDRKVTGANKEVYKVLWNACSPERLEWLINNLRIRHSISPELRVFLPSGTSSNEALHAEINSWLRTTNSLHRSTLRLKLHLMHYKKVLAHHVAMCYPFIRAASEGVILSRALAASLWSDESWASWCGEQTTGGRQMKADLPLARARSHEIGLVREWVRKKPASHKKRSVKRTPFNAKRQHKLKLGGLKSAKQT